MTVFAVPQGFKPRVFQRFGQQARRRIIGGVHRTEAQVHGVFPYYRLQQRYRAGTQATSGPPEPVVTGLVW
ncbi:hypothetical protein GCM10007053_05190 [Halioglobus pacificus]|uniref:Uncharacterized protein n=1 Tax=Parahalioglobus pacificus TaxID=930806 RepID=A0A918XDI7_9GAMM|nr:hypothetical protein GCM10007053_05190 [Halioglobus pacificus]